MHAGVAQAAHFLDQQFLDLVSALQGALGVVSDVEDALDSFPHLGMLTQSIKKLRLRLAYRYRTDILALHPHCN
jgi:hypothetical protein